MRRGTIAIGRGTLPVVGLLCALIAGCGGRGSPLRIVEILARRRIPLPKARRSFAPDPVEAGPVFARAVEVPLGWSELKRWRPPLSGYFARASFDEECERDCREDIRRECLEYGRADAARCDAIAADRCSESVADSPAGAEAAESVATWFPPSNAPRPEEEVAIQALAIEAGGRRFVWVSVDTAFVCAPFVRWLQDQAALPAAGYRPPDLLIVSATHSHSGPGGFIRRAGYWAGSDRLDKDFRAYIRRKALEAIRGASLPIAGMRKATIGWVDLPTRDLAGFTNRRLKDPSKDRRPENRPEAWPVLAVRDAESRRTMAAVLLMTVHPTYRSACNQAVSADLSGVIRRRIAAGFGDSSSRPVVMALQGAAGDLGPSPDHSASEIRDQIATLAIGAIRAVKTSPDAALRWAAATWRPGTPRLKCRQSDCDAVPSAEQTAARGHRHVGPGGYPPEERLVRKPGRGGLGFPLKGAAASTGVIQAVEIAGRCLVTAPVELTHRAGVAIRQAVEGAAAMPAVLVSSTQGYMSYQVSQDQLENQCGETCLSLYGRKALPKLLRASAEAAAQLRPANSE